ncbi:S8 family serine peptidase [uncultured Microbacterium sp.]|uniref:S8 family serine peptidase n=1 Tax=uncultured Microbacterium sp. TaxID=191216 RepID=UPI00262422ED|nr:S8 family serine peptidase [uncultured Microbacterium sp.]
MNRPQKATTLAGILAGLESGGRKWFPDSTGDSDEEDDLGRVVLKFTTKGAPKKGPLATLSMIPLGENGENEFFTLSSAESRRLFAELVQRYGGTAPSNIEDPATWFQLLDQIEDIELYDRSDRIDPSLAIDSEASQAVDIVLWPTSILPDIRARRLAAERVEEILAVVTGADGSVVASDPRPDAPLVRAVVDAPLLSLLLDHPVVERVRGPLAATIAPSHFIDAAFEREIPTPAGAAIGVVDDLVIRANLLMDSAVVESASFPAGKVFGAATAHATNVASIAAYGGFDETVRGGELPIPFPIISARIAESDAAGNPTISGSVVTLFEDALTWIAQRGARIAVIAFGYDHADTDPLPTELTATIDRLSRDLKLVIVVSAGNLRRVTPHHWRDDYPTYLDHGDARIAAPGAAALAVTVGSVALRDVAHDQTLTAIAPSNELSPFSRTGPTRGNRFGKTRKPEFLAPGGNLGWRDGGSSPVHGDTNLSVVTLSTSAVPAFTSTAGTSVAAPFVAHELAKIATRYPSAGPNLLRALLALSAHAPADRPGQALSEGIGTAYGVPDAERILESGGHRAIMTFEGEVQRGGRHIFALPVPAEFASAFSGAQRRLRVALAFDPPVRRSRRDYIAGRMIFDFVRNMDLDLVKRTWEEQPSIAEAASQGLERLELPSDRRRPKTIPGVDALRSNTIVRRDVETNNWSEDDEDYFLVVSHDSSPWTTAQLDQYPTQTYALAIELIDEARTSLDLHALTEARLAALARQEVRARVS